MRIFRLVQNLVPVNMGQLRDPVLFQSEVVPMQTKHGFAILVANGDDHSHQARLDAKADFGAGLNHRIPLRYNARQ